MSAREPRDGGAPEPASGCEVAADALQHLVGFLRPALPPAERRAILEVVEDYRRRLAPLAAPHALVRHSLGRVGHPWAEAQVYLQPHPKELAAWA